MRYRELLALKNDIERDVLIILNGESLVHSIELFRLILENQGNWNITEKQITVDAVKRLYLLKTRVNSAEFFRIVWVKLLDALDNYFLDTYNQERQQNAPNLQHNPLFLEQAIEQVIDGCGDFFSGINAWIRDPIQTAMGSIENIVNPRTYSAILNQARQQPIRLATSFGLSFAAGRVLGSITGQIAESVNGISQTSAQLSSTTQALQALNTNRIPVGIRSNFPQLASLTQVQQIAEFKGLQLAASNNLLTGVTQVNNVMMTTTSTPMLINLFQSQGQNKSAQYRYLVNSALNPALLNYAVPHLSSEARRNVQRRNRKLIPKYLAIAGGGPKGIVHLGALQILHESGITLDVFKGVSGTSAGAILAGLISVGYNLEELRSILTGLNFAEFLDDVTLRNGLFILLEEQKKGFSLESLFSINRDFKQKVREALNRNKGLFSGQALRTWIERHIVEKLRQYRDLFPTDEHAKLATFGDLELLKGRGAPIKSLVVIGTNTSTHVPTPIVFSAAETPDVLIVDAIRISLSIPYIYYPHQIYIRQNGRRILDPNNRAFCVDGGLFINYPLKAFDYVRYLSNPPRGFQGNHPIENEETLGLYIENDIELYEAFIRNCDMPQRENNAVESHSVLGTVDRALRKFDWLFPASLLRMLLTINNEIQLSTAITFDAQQLAQHYNFNDWKRTMYLSPGNITTLSFNLTQADVTQGITNGRWGGCLFMDRTEFHHPAPANVARSRNTCPQFSDMAMGCASIVAGFGLFATKSYMVETGTSASTGIDITAASMLTSGIYKIGKVFMGQRN